MTSCTCRACAQNGEPFPGISVSSTMHIVAGELGRVPAPLEAPKVIVVRKRARPRARNALVTFTNEQVTDFMGHIIREIYKEIDTRYAARIKALEAKIAELGSFDFKGGWQSAMTYERGDFCVYDGSLWHANHDGVRSQPGSNGDWQLAVRKGRDARDESLPRVPTRSRRQP